MEPALEGRMPRPCPWAYFSCFFFLASGRRILQNHSGLRPVLVDEGKPTRKMRNTIGTLMTQLIEAARKSPKGLDTEVNITIAPEDGEGIYGCHFNGVLGNDEDSMVELRPE